MPSSTPKTAKPAAEPKTQPASQPPPPPPEPFLRFYHAASLRTKTLAVLTTLEQAQDSTPHRAVLAELVLELTDTGLAYYFIRPLKQAHVGFVVEQAAHLGLSGVKRVMAPVIRHIIGQLDHHQLLTVCSHIRELMV